MSNLIDQLHRASQLVEDAYVKAQPPNGGLTPRQALTLGYIIQHEGCSQTDISENTGIDRSTLADIAQRLHDSGFIERKRSKRDARTYVLRPSATGRRAYDSALKSSLRMEDTVLARLPAPKQRALMSSLSDLIDALESKHQEQAAA